MKKHAEARDSFKTGHLRHPIVAATAAARRIRPFVRRTPLVPSPALSEATGAEVALKLECWQVTRSFKVRGAYNFLLSLGPAARGVGLVAASAGNHALGVAHAARGLGFEATLMVPTGASRGKVEATRRLGARVVERGATYDEAEDAALELASQTKALFVHAFDDPRVGEGQGTVGLELAEDWPEVDDVVVPVGGGGLAAGVAMAVKEARPGVRVIGVQPEASAPMAASFGAGRFVEVPIGPSLADGLAGRTSRSSFERCRAWLDGVWTVSEPAIARAMVWCLERERLVVEGSGAVGVAALLEAGRAFSGRRVAVVLTGGNVDGAVLRGVMGRCRQDGAG